MEFNSKEEENYYGLLEDMLEDGIIDESERSLLNKRKDKYGVSDERAKEFEDYIKVLKVLIILFHIFLIFLIKKMLMIYWNKVKHILMMRIMKKP